jgi:hypothetical protein
MLGIMGNVDQQVNDKADSMQMQGKTSTVSKDLLDVMATQKIAQEKDVALKELQMAQQQNPNTIKDQLEQKVMGMTQSEMTNQTAGIMAQRQQQKQQPRPPQQGGIAGARPPMPMAGGRPPMGGAPKPPMGGMPPMGGAPRPPMPMAGGMPMGGARPPMMASGGIVGYNKGSIVISDAELKKLGLSRQEFDALPAVTKQRLASDKRGDEDRFGFSPSRKQEQLQGLADASKKEMQALAGLPSKFGQFIQDDIKKNTIDRAKSLGVSAADLGQYDTSGIKGAIDTLQPSAPKQPFLPTPTGKAPPPQTGTPVGTITDAENAEIDAAIAAQKANQGNQGGAAGAKAGTTSMTSNLEELDPNKIRAAMDNAETINQSPISDRMGDTAMNRLESDAKLNPMDQLQKTNEAGEKVDGDEVARLKGLYGLAELKNMQTTEQSDIKKAQERYDDPEAKRLRKVRNYALGGSRAMFAGEAEEETLELKRLRKKQEERRKNFAEIFSVVDKVDSGARQMFQDIQTQQMAALASMESIASNNELAKQNYMKLAGDAEGKAQELILGAMGVESENALRATIANMQSVQQLLDSWQEYQEGVRAAEVDMMNRMAPVIDVILTKQAKGEELDDGEKLALTNATNMAKSFVGAGNEGIVQAYMKQLEILQPGFRGLSNQVSMFGGQSSGLAGFQPSGMGQVGQRGPSQSSSSPQLKSQALVDMFNKNQP